MTAMKNLATREQKVELMLQEAKRLFWFQGFDRTSIPEIAKVCECTQGNIYNYFDNKEDILYQVILGEMKRLIKLIKPLEHNLDMKPDEQLEALIEQHVKHTLGPAKGELLQFELETNHLSPEHKAEIIDLRDTYDRILRRIIRRGINAGIFAEVDEKLINFAIASLIVRARLWYSPKGELSLDELAKSISELFLNGLYVRK